MNRKHSVKKYLEIIDKLKDAKPDIALSSDFIVGFPGETDKDFDLTMQLIDNVKFVIAYSFIFSPRPGTPAYEMKELDKSIKQARLSALQSLLKKQQKNYNETFIGKKIDVLFDKKGRYTNQYIGRTVYNQSVFVESKNNLIGDIINTSMIRSTNFALEGKI